MNLSYPEGTLTYEACILIGLFIIETIRIVFGRAGSLSDHCKYLFIKHMLLKKNDWKKCIFFLGWQVICSVFLTIPSMIGVTYLLCFQHQKLRLEYILCALMLTLQVVELVFASIFVCTSCRPVSYD